MIRNHLLASLLTGASLLPSGLAADEPDFLGRVLGAALTEGKAYEKLAYLTDRIGHRLSGSKSLDKAIEWATAEMNRDGLDKVWTEKVMVPRWVRGVESGRILSPAEHRLAIIALGMSDPTPEGGITAEVFEVASFEEVKAAGERLKGKIVLYNKPIYANGGEERGYGAAAGLRYRGAVEAAKQGAVGMLIRSLGTANYRLPHTGAMAYEDGVPHIPAAAISAEDADRIHRFLAAGEPVRVQFALGCGTLPEVESANVLAEIFGREKPGEVVLIGAHLDSWDVGSGAIDDGAGSVIVMEAMRVLKSLGQRPRRTIRVVLFTNEENGLRGGKAYAEAHKAEVASHVAAIESDSGGAKPLGFGVTAGSGGIEMVRRIASHLALLGADTVTPGGGGADISPLAAGHVPLMGLHQDSTRYFDYHHTEADTLDKVDPGELGLNVAAMAVMAYALADMPETLPRTEGEPAKGEGPTRRRY